ncbi:MAG: polysaccharide biosynthesis/export family protein [Pseudomonadota bacterium]
MLQFSIGFARFRLIFALAVLIGVAVFATLAQAQQYRIQAGDVLRIEVLEDASMNREVLVAPDGRISMPLAGSLRLGGASIPEAQQRVTAALASSFATRPNVLVSLVQLRDVAPRDPDNVFVIGEVNNPGKIAIDRGTTLLQALSVAGGVTDFAAVKRIQLRRTDRSGHEKVYTFNYQAVLNGQSSIGTSPVQKGDVIVVPPRRLFE